MRRILTQRETFAYRVAGGLFDAIMSGGGSKGGQNIDALPQGDSPAPYEAAAAAEMGKQGPRVPKMVVRPGAPGGSSAGSNGGGSRGGGGGGGGGTPDGSGILPNARPLYDQLMKEFPGSNIGGYRVDDFHEHDHGALDFMTTDPNQAAKVRQDAFAAGAPYVLWQQKQWNSDGSVSPMNDRGDPTQNHYDHVHIAPI